MYLSQPVKSISVQVCNGVIKRFTIAGSAAPSIGKFDDPGTAVEQLVKKPTEV